MLPGTLAEAKVILHTHKHTYTHISKLDLSTTIAFGKLILSKITFSTKMWVISSIACSNKYIHCYISSLLWNHTSGSGMFLASSLCQHSSCGSGPFSTAPSILDFQQHYSISLPFRTTGSNGFSLLQVSKCLSILSLFLKLAQNAINSPCVKLSSFKSMERILIIMIRTNRDKQ